MRSIWAEPYPPIPCPCHWLGRRWGENRILWRLPGLQWQATNPQGWQSGRSKMHVTIFADIEGAFGIWRMRQCRTGTREWQYGRECLTADVNHIILGAFDGGADRVPVKDTHDTGFNCLKKKLDKSVGISSNLHYLVICQMSTWSCMQPYTRHPGRRMLSSLIPIMEYFPKFC